MKEALKNGPFEVRDQLNIAIAAVQKQKEKYYQLSVEVEKLERSSSSPHAMAKVIHFLSDKFIRNAIIFPFLVNSSTKKLH